MTLFNKREFIRTYNNKIPQIISKYFIADTDTPVSALLKISQNQEYSFLLESVEGGEQRGKYSLLGCDPDLIWKVEKGKVKITTDSKFLKENIKLNLNPIESLRMILKLSKVDKNINEPPYPILVGYLGYPMIQYMENINLNNPDPLKIPEAMIIRPKIVAVFDNIKDTIHIMTVIYPEVNIYAEKALEMAEERIALNIKKLKSQILKNEIPKNKDLIKGIRIKIIVKIFVCLS